ncbi:MAG: hypothetical protein OEY51_05890, partial [Cyclobacteriaceae bacterium]|nr:hypothetical protein [Cyclobacteriaceae bacterium]
MLSYSLNVLFIIGAVQAFFLATLVFSKKNKITGDYVLGTWIGFMGIHLFNYYLFASGFLEKYPSLISIGTNFPMLQGPFMFVYVMVMISRENRIKPSWWFHALPYLLSLAYFLVDYQFLSYEEKMAYIEMAKMDPKPVILVMKLLNVTTGPFYVILSLIKLNKH